MNTSEKRRIAGALMAKSGAVAYKSDVLSAYGCDRIRDLTDDQLEDLIRRLSVISEAARGQDRDLRKQRSVVLSMCEQIGVKPYGSNWQNVNQFLLQKRVAGKLLYEMDMEELKACAMRIRAIQRKKQKTDSVYDYLAKYN